MKMKIIIQVYLFCKSIVTQALFPLYLGFSIFNLIFIVKIENFRSVTKKNSMRLALISTNYFNAIVEKYF